MDSPFTSYIMSFIFITHLTFNYYMYNLYTVVNLNIKVIHINIQILQSTLAYDNKPQKSIEMANKRVYPKYFMGTSCPS